MKNSSKQKSLAKVAMLSATLAIGIQLGDSLFAEAQATGAGGWKFSYCVTPQGTLGGACYYSPNPDCGDVALCS